MVVVVVGIVVVVIIVVVIVTRSVLLFGPLVNCCPGTLLLLLLRGHRHRLHLLRQRHRIRQREDAVLDHRIVAGKVHVLQRLDRRQRGAIFELDEATQRRGRGLDPSQLFAATVTDELLAVDHHGHGEQWRVHRPRLGLQVVHEVPLQLVQHRDGVLGLRNLLPARRLPGLELGLLQFAPFPCRNVA